MEYVLETNALCKYYRNFKALDGLDMRVPKGSIYGFVGKNGAGKTTLIRVVTGLQHPTSGSYKLYGCEIGKNGSDKTEVVRTRQRIGAVVESPSIYSDMTAYENIGMQYTVLGMPDESGINELLELVGLGNTGKKKAKHFSLGMRQRLGIAVALAGSPDLLILDEPVNGLDPQGIIEMRELILKLNREMGITVIISSHILDELSKLATHYGFIDGGRMVREMSAKELEAAAKKRTLVRVDNIEAFARALEKCTVEYEIVSENEACLYGVMNASDIFEAARSEGCSILFMSEKDESLESFYLNLLGGAKNE